MYIHAYTEFLPDVFCCWPVSMCWLLIRSENKHFHIMVCTCIIRIPTRMYGPKNVNEEFF